MAIVVWFPHEAIKTPVWLGGKCKQHTSAVTRRTDYIGMEFVLVTGAVAITAVIIWIGRKRLKIAVPCAFAFLLYASILIPNILPPRTAYAQHSCVGYLRLIQNAKADWAEKNRKSPSDVPRLEELFSSNNASPYQWIPKCPNGGKYNVGAVNQNPSCTLSNVGHTLR